MRKIPLIALFTSIALLLSGCGQLTQVENLAFVILFGVDLTDDGQIEVIAQIPKITGSKGESDSGGSASSDALVYSADGADFLTALTNLNWAVPRRLDLSQIELIAVSERLARSGRFMEIMDEMMDFNRLYTAARLAVCTGSVKEFIQAEKPVIGSHIANELDSMFADYVQNGYVPDVTFADVYYKTISIYSDPLTIYAEQSGAAADAQAASLIIPEAPEVAGADMEQSNRFLGAAVLHDGVMAGKLDGQEQLLCKLLSGEQQSFAYSYGENTLYLTTLGRPKISVDTRSEPAGIRIKLRLSLVPDNETTRIDGLNRAIKADLLETIDACKRMGVEPFGFAEVAARSFPTIDEWRDYDWHSHFLSSHVEASVSVAIENA